MWALPLIWHADWALTCHLPFLFSSLARAFCQACCRRAFIWFWHHLPNLLHAHCHAEHHEAILNWISSVGNGPRAAQVVVTNNHGGLTTTQQVIVSRGRNNQQCGGWRLAPLCGGVPSLFHSTRWHGQKTDTGGFGGMRQHALQQGQARVSSWHTVAAQQLQASEHCH
jgi:hypothetical protein